MVDCLMWLFICDLELVCLFDMVWVCYGLTASLLVLLPLVGCWLLVVLVCLSEFCLLLSYGCGLVTLFVLNLDISDLLN